MLKFLFIKKRNIELPEQLKKLQKKKKIELIPIENIQHFTFQEIKTFNAILCLGGDGTFLRAVPYAYKYDLPILGVNMGHFGFLTETYIEELPETINLLEKGNLKTEERTLLKITYEDKVFLALNEGAIMKGPAGKIIYLTINFKFNGR